MPCESCTAQFTVFKRKRNCSECRRYYCNQCLTKRNNLILCQRCLIFTKRPLYKIDLQKLKSKDLIFYLQSKHISTTGCVEKDELVNLILNHVNSSSNINSNNSSRHNSTATTNNDIPKTKNSPDGDNTNPFNQLKQSCHSFFSSVTEKIAADLNFGDNNTTKSPTSPTSSTSSSGRQQQPQQQNNISDQPRIITREIPTYSSQQNNNSYHNKHRTQKPHTTNIPLNSPNSPTTPVEHTVPNPNTSSSTSSPILSLSSISSQSISSQQQQQSQSQQQPQQQQQQNTTFKQLNNENIIPKIHKTANNRKIFETVLNNCNTTTTNNSGNSSGCECSDDEIITKYEIRQQQQQKCKEKLSPTTTISSSQTDSGCDEQIGCSNSSSSCRDDGAAGPSGNNNTGPNTISKNSSLSIQNKDFDDSSGSSFEELGAVGGINNEIINNNNSSNTVIIGGNCNSDNGSGCTTNSSDNENWQIINQDDNNQQQQILQNDNQIELNSFQLQQQQPPLPSTIPQQQHSINDKSLVIFADPSSSTSSSSASTIALNNLRFGGITPNQRTILRRRSDGFLNSRQNRLPIINDELIDYGIASSSGRNISRVDEEDSNDDIGAAGDNCIDNIQMSRKRLKKSCTKCGKTKKNLKRHVDKFQKHLESKKLSDIEIKEELKAFLEYLECRQKSIDCSSDDSDSNNDILSESEFRQHVANDYEDRYLYNGSDDGIHVYAHNDNDYEINQSRYNNRFISLNDFKSIDEFDDLTVKQLKEILMLNRVDFKGCCEKQELLERVHRLWKNLQECPAVDKLQVDDLCKICMDAPIECVILECGHMATCTNCGKVLSECPICRQYIVRVVRFFRA